MPNRIMVPAQIHTVLQIAPKCKKGVKGQELVNAKTTTICTTAACSTPCCAAPVNARQLPKNVSTTKKEAFRRPNTRLVSASVVPLDIYSTSDKLLICFPLAWQTKNQRYNKITV